MEIFPVFQPIVDTFDARKVIGQEALLRGKRGRQYVSAKTVFEHAAEFGGVPALDRMARDRALALGVPELEPNQRLFINLAAASLQEPEPWFSEGAPLAQVVLEISERTNSFLTDGARDQFHAVREKGALLALDDYGVERANLHLLADLNPEYLKLDLSFVRARRWDLIRRVRRFTEDFPGMQLIVEGVETEEQVQRLLDCGVRYAQGFVFGKPGPLPVASGSPVS